MRYHCRDLFLNCIKSKSIFVILSIIILFSTLFWITFSEWKITEKYQRQDGEKKLLLAEDTLIQQIQLNGKITKITLYFDTPDNLMKQSFDIELYQKAFVQKQKVSSVLGGGYRCF